MQLFLISAGHTIALKTGVFPSPADHAVLPTPLFDWKTPTLASLQNTVETFCSPYKNAQETAQWISIPPKIIDELSDFHYGIWSGQPLKTIIQNEPQFYKNWQKDINFSIPQGESQAQFYKRVLAWFNTLSQTCPPNKTILGITHPLVIKVLIAHILDTPPTLTLPIDVSPLTYTRFSFWNTWRIQTLNCPLL